MKADPAPRPAGARGLRLLALRPPARGRRGGGRLEEGDRRSVRPLADSIGIELAVGVGLFTACTAGFRRTLGLGTSKGSLVAAAVALATIPLGTDASAVLQLAALTAIVVGALLVEARAEVSGQRV